ncbi:hypothetical protein [Nocardioides marmorisolisilvae]|uniref:hypothetical protein n=1 Tax=Nocardioides marmorisolisilvae TaxID=1542737 RepID=UPI0016158471|nr:hypothetical protein [Nocardioides marmorisolisilvae]
MPKASTKATIPVRSSDYVEALDDGLNLAGIERVLELEAEIAGLHASLFRM